MSNIILNREPDLSTQHIEAHAKPPRDQKRHIIEISDDEDNPSSLPQPVKSTRAIEQRRDGTIAESTTRYGPNARSSLSQTGPSWSNKRRRLEVGESNNSIASSYGNDPFQNPFGQQREQIFTIARDGASDKLEHANTSSGPSTHISLHRLNSDQGISSTCMVNRSTSPQLSAVSGKRNNPQFKHTSALSPNPSNLTTNLKQQPKTAHYISDTRDGPSKMPMLVLEDSPHVKAPYYDDPKFGVRMYCGPGFGKFPVVLGTVTGHKEACDKWDKEKEKKQNPVIHVQTDTSDTNIDSRQRFGKSESNQPALQCFRGLLEILPDLEHEFAHGQIRQRSDQIDMLLGDETLIHMLATNLASQILEMESYPRQKRKPKLRSTKEETVDDTGMTIVWNRQVLKNLMYLKGAVILLAGQYSHVPSHHVYKIVYDKKSIFDSYLLIHQSETDYFSIHPRPYNRLRHPRGAIEKKYDHNKKDQQDPKQWADMINELQAAKQHVARDSIKEQERKDKEDFEDANLTKHKMAGTLVECQCCFDHEIPMNRSVTCESDITHLFCFGCIARLAESQVGNMRYEMNCMDSSGCRALLSIEGVGRAVPIKTFDKLAFNQQQAEIAAAAIEGLEQCPFCDFKAILEPVEVDSVFNCQNPDCERSSCRKCKEDNHIPKTCAEAKDARGLNARHLVEEARTNAMIRPCPRCGIKIVKEVGCNKMRCTKCGCLMCYECKADISSGKESGYEHFHRPGAKCKLSDHPNVDRHDAEADEAERAAIEKAKAEDHGIDEDQLQVGKELNRFTKKPRTTSEGAFQALPFGPPQALPFGYQMPDGPERNVLQGQPPGLNALGQPRAHVENNGFEENEQIWRAERRRQVQQLFDVHHRMMRDMQARQNDWMRGFEAVIPPFDVRPNPQPQNQFPLDFLGEPDRHMTRGPNPTNPSMATARLPQPNILVNPQPRAQPQTQYQAPQNQGFEPFPTGDFVNLNNDRNDLPFWNYGFPALHNEPAAIQADPMIDQYRYDLPPPDFPNFDVLRNEEPQFHDWDYYGNQP